VRRPSIYICQAALRAMTIGGADTFRQESIGLVLGEKPKGANKHFRINLIVPIAKVDKRSTELAHPNQKSFDRMRNVIEDFPPDYEILGYFHSHTHWKILGIINTHISDRDKKSFREDGYHLDLVISIFSRKKKGRSSWQVSNDGSLRGSFGRFRYCVRAYMIDGEGKQAEVVGIPFLKSSLRGL
jgi:hypothetical protein